MQWTLIAGQPVKVHVAVSTLSYSRRFHFWGTDSEDAEHTYEALVARSAGMSFALRLQARISALVADRFAWLSPSATARRFDACPSDSISDGHPALLASRDATPPGSARPLVYASPLRGCGGTFTRKRNALLGAQPQAENRLA